MKKRCTNSACRKQFILDIVCPHCGKQYPRNPARNKPMLLADILLNSIGPSRTKTLFILHERFDMSLLEAKQCTDACPSIIATGIPLKDAEELVNLFEKVGATACIRRTYSK